ncbi:MAG TPA: hypothetical protein VNL96_02715, partial [Gemmatimonadaceae bacterium]|nr:hypothetical protein [Gemmatimonadaceae bacterium]
MIVTKFGGTSVEDAAAIRRVVSIVRSRLPLQPLVVVSALAGTTNALLELAELAGAGNLVGAIRGVEALRQRHLAVAAELLEGRPSAGEVSSELGATFDELANLAEAFSILGHVTPRSLDAVAAKGEFLSTVLLVAALRE